MNGRVRTAIRVEGTVQGVGFRPFVHGLARRLGLAGLVGNDAAGVFAEVEGTPEAVAEFLAALRSQAPPLARIERITTSGIPVRRGGDFVIAPSRPGGAKSALVSADSATCADCLRELADPGDRRYGYPFINCTNCGPRYTIVRDVPYDRPQTTMAPFAMCAACAAEYADPADRRFHAQPVCCPDCGPALALTLPDGTPVPGEAIFMAAERLRGGQVVAVKGLGGYHLAADASAEAPAAALRARKHREDKPFAVMVASLDAARRLGEVDAAAEALLMSPGRPVVLVPRRPDAPVAAAVAPGNRQLGLLLPYTPLHHLLLAAVGRPIVLTSGNLSGEPITFDDDDARARLGAVADAILSHDRAIWARADDSVARAFRGRAMLLRRARGYAPDPVPLPVAAAQPVLACGAELKATFCLAAGHRAFLSPHIGDLENAETYASFTAGIGHFQRLFGIEPRIIAHDLHPDYLSAKYALARAEDDGLTAVGVQHHHAHIAACLADNGTEGPVIGVAFDGTGYGPDGTVWGGEFLIASLDGYQRAGHLAPVAMPGGAAAVRQPWRMAAAYLDAAGLELGGLAAGASAEAPAVAHRNAGRWDAVVSMGRRGVNAPRTSSAGRLFDAVAALLGVRDVISYEGQAAIELEQLADPAAAGVYRARVRDGEPFVVRGADLVAAAAADLAADVPAAVIAARFHHGVARLIVAGCERLRGRHGLATVALSGGVFQNLTLTTEVTGQLTERGFTVLTHAQVPCNDGGISLGQAVVAIATTA